MNSLFTIFALLALVLVATTVESRVGPGGYEKIVIERIPEDLWKLVKEKFELNNVNNLSDKKAEKADCHDTEKPKIEIEEFEPRPNVSVYHNDSEVKGSSKSIDNMESKDNGSKDKLSFEAKAKTHAFEEDFEPRPNVSMYND
ncbi:organ-specific protein P4-like [Argentina anserina]|uniref:organ-specific protein P4-like n=1 Tax=Argentina anserina TaxID=57926 RepID=UPI0021765384|nr:organ-specific protein P4-like [Potentilla anserina]